MDAVIDQVPGLLLTNFQWLCQDLSSNTCLVLRIPTIVSLEFTRILGLPLLSLILDLSVKCCLLKLTSGHLITLVSMHEGSVIPVQSSCSLMRPYRPTYGHIHMDNGWEHCDKENARKCELGKITFISLQITDINPSRNVHWLMPETPRRIYLFPLMPYYFFTQMCGDSGNTWFLFTVPPHGCVCNHDLIVCMYVCWMYVDVVTCMCGIHPIRAFSLILPPFFIGGSRS